MLSLNEHYSSLQASRKEAQVSASSGPKLCLGEPSCCERLPFGHKGRRKDHHVLEYAPGVNGHGNRLWEQLFNADTWFSMKKGMGFTQFGGSGPAVGLHHQPLWLLAEPYAEQIDQERHETSLTGQDLPNLQRCFLCPCWFTSLLGRVCTTGSFFITDMGERRGPNEQDSDPKTCQLQAAVSFGIFHALPESLHFNNLLGRPS